jgi:hypothetical protein
MASYRIDRVQPWGGAQVILWLADARTGATEDEDGLTFCIQLKADAIAPLIHDLANAHNEVLSRIMLELAAGGCRTCGNRRKVNVNHLAALMGGDEGGEPCPTCVPRAEERIRKAAHLPKPRTP